MCEHVIVCRASGTRYVERGVRFTHSGKIQLILLTTTSGVTSNCPNLSPSGLLNFVSRTGNELLSSLVNTELKCKFNSSGTVLLYSQHCPPVVQPYLEHSAFSDIRIETLTV